MKERRWRRRRKTSGKVDCDGVSNRGTCVTSHTKSSNPTCRADRCDRAHVKKRRMNSSCGEASSSIRSVGLFLIVCCVATKRAPPSIIIHMRVHASYRSVSFGAQRAHSDAIIRNRKHTTIIFIIECLLSRRIAIKFVCAAIAALCDVRWYHDGWDRPWEFMRRKIRH